MADRDCVYGCLAVRLARVCGLSLQPRGCMSALACEIQRYCSSSCHLWCYISVMPLPFFEKLSANSNIAQKCAAHICTEPKDNKCTWKIFVKKSRMHTRQVQIQNVVI